MKEKRALGNSETENKKFVQQKVLSCPDPDTYGKLRTQCISWLGYFKPTPRFQTGIDPGNL